MAVLKTETAMIDIDAVRGLVKQVNFEHPAVAAIFDGHAIIVQHEDAEALWDVYEKNCQSFTIDKDGKSVPVKKRGK